MKQKEAIKKDQLKGIKSFVELVITSIFMLSRWKFLLLPVGKAFDFILTGSGWKSGMFIKLRKVWT